MQLKEMIEKLPIIIGKQKEEELDHILCEAVQLALENNWNFLLEIIYDFQMDNPVLRQGYLVIGYEQPKDGFKKMKTVPMEAILSKDLKGIEEISFEDKASYVKQLVYRIPCQERKIR